LELTLKLELHPAVVPHSVDQDAMSALGVNYSSVSKAVYAALDRAAFSSPAAILDAAATVPLALPAVKRVDVRARLPRALLHGDAAYARSYTNTSSVPRATTLSGSRKSPLTLAVSDIRCAALVGLHPHERGAKQRLEVDVSVNGAEDGSHRVLADAALEVSEL
jgi:dihydroneopterin aldolase/2-amino-4-hydroxy-6-hydroxymethyldihydropteridine diphosphokinase/dihydropteroate synthase